jgi:hypothetical protein
VTNESKARGVEILWSFSFWLLGGVLVYVLSYGPAVWLEPKIESKNIRSLMESAFVPAGYLLFNTPLRPFGVWYVSKWVPVHGG